MVAPAAEIRASRPNRPCDESKRIALSLPSLTGGGAERATLNLTRAFSNLGHRVDLVLCRAEGELRDQVPTGVAVVQLRPASRVWSRLRVLAADPSGFASLLRPVLLPIKTSRIIRYLPDFVRYLRREQPQVLVSSITDLNLVALWARRLAGVSTHLVVCEHNNLSQMLQADSNRRKWCWRFLPPVISRTYPWAETIVSVSTGVADDLSIRAQLPRERILTIYNPIVTPDSEEEEGRALSDHPWFVPGSPPVLLAVGRLVLEKDFPTLLKAFARVRELRPARLVILGEGKERTKLEALARELGVAADVALPGFVANPFPYMARAAVLVLSSVYEGLPTVVVEALACGCPVVSTDCPSGPAEILEGGRYGALVPVRDVEAMAMAINVALDGPHDRERLKTRAAEFSLEGAIERYLAVLCAMSNPPAF